jgi:hypothetical protein
MDLSQDKTRNELSTVSILIPLRRALLEKLTGLQLVSKLRFMKVGGSSLNSQQLFN